MRDTIMGISIAVILILLWQFELSNQACQECTCCKDGASACDSDQNCTEGCIAGYFGAKCTEQCPENCQTCVKGNGCTKCNRGYYAYNCTLQCGKGCLDNTCDLSGQCTCASSNFKRGECKVCSDTMYGDICNNTCPSSCDSCISDTDCTSCLNSMFYGSHCQNSCSIGCNLGMCNKSDGHCIDGCKSGFSGVKCDQCLPGLYGKYCKLRCGKGCVNNTCSHMKGECLCKSHNFSERKCDACSDTWYGDSCNNSCPSNCGSCISESECSVCNNNVYYGSYCQYRCSHGCNRGTCDTVTGYCTQGCNPNFRGNKCDLCSHGLYGKFCDLNCSENCYSCISKTNCTECKSGFYGKTCTHPCPSGCDRNCSLKDGLCFGCKPGFVEEFCYNTCINKTYGVNCSISCHNKDNNCHGCIDGYEGSTCALAIEGSEENKSQVIIVTSTGAGVVVIILLTILVSCLVKRQRRRKLSTTRKCVENDYVQDMQEINKQHDADESADIYAQSSKPIRQASDDAAHGDDNKISAFDNGYTMVNIGTSAKENNKSFEVCDTALDNKCIEVLSGNNDYAVVNKAKSAVKRNEGMEEMYDITPDNKKKIHHLNSNNEYAVLSLRSDKVAGFVKTKGAEAAEGDDLYDTTEGGKHKTMPRPSNDYAVFKRNNGDKDETVKSNTRNDTTIGEKKMRQVNNDYEFECVDSE